MDDGRTLVFAHLSAFADPIQALVTRAQASSGRYQQDIWPSAEQLAAFQQGDLLALSGATGTGAPHLHIEIRGADGRPQNPLLSGLEPSDERAPVISEFRLLPLDPSSRIDGRARAVAVEPGGQLRATGKIGVQLRAKDYTEHASFPLMPARVELFVDGESVYSMAQESFDFAESGQMRLEIDRDGGARWIRLYRREGNALQHREGPHGFSFELAGDGREHLLECVVGDAAGNEARASLQLLATSDWALSTAAEAPFDSLAPGLAVHFGEAVCELRTAALPTGAEWVGKGLAAMGTAATARWLGERGWPFAIAGGERRERTEFGDRGLWIEDGDGSAMFAGGLLRLGGSRSIAADELPEGCEALGPAVELRSHGAAFADELLVGWEFLAPLAPGSALFARTGNGRWKCIADGEGTTATALRGTINRPGWIAPILDGRAPQIGNWRVDGGGEVARVSRLPVARRGLHDGLRLPAWPAILVDVREEGAGLAVEDVITRLDGKLFPARFDPEDGFIAFDFHVEPAPGEHLAEVELRDRVGNVARAEARFTLLP
jgi:hypothetical protein